MYFQENAGARFFLEPEIVHGVRLIVGHVRRVKRRCSLLQQTMSLVEVEIAHARRRARLDLPLARQLDQGCSADRGRLRLHH